MKDMANIFRTAFPDIKVTVPDMIAEGDKVVGDMSFAGTNTGEFMGMPATNKTISIEEIHIARIANVKMVEHWGIADEMGMMTQLGLAQQH